MISNTKLLQFITAFLLFIGLADMKATAQVVENPKEVCDLLNRIGGEGTAERIATAIDPSVTSAGREAFVLTSQDGKPCIKGSNVSALTTGINWYLNHYAHVNIAWNNLTTDLSQVEFPVPTKQEKHSTTVGYRYYLNYCTFSYSMSTWTWERWQRKSTGWRSTASTCRCKSLVSTWCGRNSSRKIWDIPTTRPTLSSPDRVSKLGGA